MRTFPFIVSILLHLLLLAGAFLTQTRTDQKQEKLIEIQFEKMVDKTVGGHRLFNKKLATVKTKKIANKNVFGSVEKIRQVLGLSQVSSLELYKKSQLQQDLEQKLAQANSLRKSGLPGAEYDGLSMHHINFTKSIWNQIDKSIVSPPYLSEYGHAGKVKLFFTIDTEGQLIEGSLKAEADDNILKVIAIRALRKALKNETQELVLPDKKVLMSAQFTWAEYATCKYKKGYGVSSLSFCNYAEDKRKKFTSEEKASEYLKALTYGFGAIDEIKKYNKEQDHRKTQFDPFEEYRRDPDWNTGA